jgi:hypothetical protein
MLSSAGGASPFGSPWVVFASGIVLGSAFAFGAAYGLSSYLVDSWVPEASGSSPSRRTKRRCVFRVCLPTQNAGRGARNGAPEARS